MMRYVSFVVALAMLFSGCEEADVLPDAKENSAQEKSAQTRAVTEQQKSNMKVIAQNNNQFACDLYSQLRNEQGNLFFSPTSISFALAMTLAGARSSTAQQMRDVLHLELPDDQLNAAFAALRTQLLSDREGMRISVANRLWGQEGFEFLPNFLSVTRNDYGAELGQLDFAQTEAARQTINTWVADQTNDKIKDLIPSGILSADTRIVLTNAVYFKAEWARKFDANSTHDDTFNVTADESVTVPFMSQGSSLRHGTTDNASFLELPYKDDKCAMWIFLPNEQDGLADFEAQLTEENLTRWMESASSKPMLAQIPKFSLSSEFQMKDVLEAMGMTDAFDATAADFSGMTEADKLFIGAVIHKAFVDVNEKGTEAAAATAVVGVRSAAPVERTIFRADHPFVYMIRDNETGSILFLGRVTNPK